MPHGVQRLAQLLMVPRGCVPLGENRVLVNVEPRAGSASSIKVAAVTRRLNVKADQAEKVQAIVVVAKAAGKVLLRAIVEVIGDAGVKEVTGGEDDCGGRTRGHCNTVGFCFADGGETRRHAGRRWGCDHWGRRGRDRCDGRQHLVAAGASGKAHGATSGHRHRADTATEHIAAVQASGQHIVKAGVGAGVFVQIVGVDGRCPALRRVTKMLDSPINAMKYVAEKAINFWTRRPFCLSIGQIGCQMAQRQGAAGLDLAQ